MKSKAIARATWIGRHTAAHCCLSLAALSAEPITPRETIALCNGKDLSNFTTWETVPGRKDPDQVFGVVDHLDGAPAIRISGRHWGGLQTRERYTRYRLVVEYRWGLVTWGSREDRARDSGILFQSEGAEIYFRRLELHSLKQ